MAKWSSTFGLYPTDLLSLRMKNIIFVQICSYICADFPFYVCPLLTNGDGIRIYRRIYSIFYCFKST